MQVNHGLIGIFPEVENVDVEFTIAEFQTVLNPVRKTSLAMTINLVAAHFYGIDTIGMNTAEVIDTIASADQELQFA